VPTWWVAFFCTSLRSSYSSWTRDRPRQWNVRCHLLPFDQGFYTVEVVLAFSRPPPWSDFPVPHEPAYEGYLLPGFPLQVNVGTDQHQQDKSINQQTSLLQTQTLPPCPAARQIQRRHHTCNMSLLTETSTKSALASGRWVLRQMNMQTNTSLSPTRTRGCYLESVSTAKYRWVRYDTCPPAVSPVHVPSRIHGSAPKSCAQPRIQHRQESFHRYIHWRFQLWSKERVFLNSLLAG
jgi:hypothetical protein